MMSFLKMDVYVYSAAFSALPPSAFFSAKLVMNLPIRFSRTIAELVTEMVSPAARFSVSPPCCSPMYCSPKSPEVRICAETSLLN
ncbi:Uncharacterised protein [Neisseria gonorrhoeae]|uniref:Uncharacterized protein n=1 Tax=Neisseria gonorrhoeae TaxID=485 RepID=A0A378W1J8_NEIGO|nr:Uncharacterised protein [Neisseria gonorrhoeae]